MSKVAKINSSALNAESIAQATQVSNGWPAGTKQTPLKVNTKIFMWAAMLVNGATLVDLAAASYDFDVAKSGSPKQTKKPIYNVAYAATIPTLSYMGTGTAKSLGVGLGMTVTQSSKTVKGSDKKPVKLALYTATLPKGQDKLSATGDLDDKLAALYKKLGIAKHC